MSDKAVRDQILAFIRKHPKSDKDAILNASQIKADEGQRRAQLLQLLGDGRVELRSDRKFVLAGND